MTDYTGQHPKGPDPTSLNAPKVGKPLPSTTSGEPSVISESQRMQLTQAELPSLKIRLRKALRQFPDFPTPGILFEDILPIFQEPDVIVGLEARGFLFGPSLALRLGSGFVPVRKKGKLPGPTEITAFEKEYGADHFEMQSDAVKKGQKVLVVDDIIATGGSAAAAGQLVQKLGGQLLGYIMILELDFLRGREKLPAPCYTLLTSQSTSSTSDPS